MTRFQTGRRAALLLVATVVLASCGGGGSIDNELSLRIIQASPDAPLVNFLIDDVRVRQFVDYRGGYGSIFATPGTYDLAVELILPGVDERISRVLNTPLLAGKDYTFIVIGKDADDSVKLMEFESPIESVPTGNVRVQVAHAAPGIDPLDVYVTAPNTNLLAAVAIGPATYGNAVARQLLPAGTYVIRVTPAGMPGTVLFESGEIPLQSGRDLLLVAVANTTTDTDSVPISLVVNEPSRPIGFTFDVLDKDLSSDLRVVHVSPDAPALDVVGDPATEGAEDVPFTPAGGLTYLGNTGYISAPPENYTVNGATTAEPDTVIFNFGRTLFAGQKAAALVIGLLATINDLVLVDDIRSVYAEGRLRIVNAAPGSGAVDVYILETGLAIESANATEGNLVLGGLAPRLGDVSTHYGVEPGNYTVTFTVAGDKTMVLATAEVAATAGTVQTAILVDAVRVDENSDGKPASVLLIDDLAD